MTREERAKQFMPFAALKGYPAALRKKEKIVVPKGKLTEEYHEELNRKLKRVQRNEIITVVYFYKDEYIKLTGMVAKIHESARILKIVNTRIPFDELYDIQGDWDVSII